MQVLEPTRQDSPDAHAQRKFQTADNKHFPKTQVRITIIITMHEMLIPSSKIDKTFLQEISHAISL